MKNCQGPFEFLQDEVVRLGCVQVGGERVAQMHDVLYNCTWWVGNGGTRLGKEYFGLLFVQHKAHGLQELRCRVEGGLELAVVEDKGNVIHKSYKG